ncbi:MAG: Rab family GTPase [Candidatus Kariarchaeaceae archaeon]
MNIISHLRKIVILGTTGSGKTTFLKNLVGDDFHDNLSEVQRNVKLEENQLYNTFSPLQDIDFVNSTTTVSMNVQSVLFLTTKTNKFRFFPMKKNTLPMPKEDIDYLYPAVIVDTAGQERFEFMQDIGLKGADAVLIFADGTNVASIERISRFMEMVTNEEQRSKKRIPVAIFVNKKDLESRGIYVGSSSVKRWIDIDISKIIETTNHNTETFLIPIRNLLDDLDGFPIRMEQIVTVN